MNKHSAPEFCISCIRHFQQACPHEHTTMLGGFHFLAGEFWDDLTLICLDCGADLDRLPFQKSIDSNSEITF